MGGKCPGLAYNASTQNSCMKQFVGDFTMLCEPVDPRNCDTITSEEGGNKCEQIVGQMGTMTVTVQKRANIR